MEVLKCPECGANIDTDSGFCKYCGAKLKDDVERKSIEITDHARMEMAKLQRERFELEKKLQKKKETAMKIKIGLLLALLMASVFVFFIVPEFLRTLYVAVVLHILLAVSVLMFSNKSKK